MANTNPIFPGVVKSKGTVYADTDLPGAKTLFTAGTNGSRIDSISVVSTDSTNRTFTLVLNDGTTDFTLGDVLIIGNSGNLAGVPAMQLLSVSSFAWLDDSGSLFIEASHLLKIIPKSTEMLEGSAITFVVFGGDY